MAQVEGPITAEELGHRLATLCLGGGGRGFPRKSRDLHIVLAAATLMEPGAVYTEAEVNLALATWLEDACPALGVDEVTLRRELVDRRFLDRDDSGAHYSPGVGSSEWRFADDVADIDPVQLIAEARQEREARRRAYQASSDRAEET